MTISIFAVVARGLTPVFPALAAVFRGLMNPLVLALLFLTFILLKMGGIRRRTSAGESAHSGDNS